MILAALAIVALFGIFAASVLGFIAVTERQHQRTEATARVNALAEGAAQYAVSSIANGAATSCSGPPTGSATYSPGAGVSDTVSFSVLSCIPKYTAPAAGLACALCVLSSSATALSINIHANAQITGQVSVNGGVTFPGGSWQGTSWKGGTICATTQANCGGSPSYIGVAGTAAAWPPPGGTCGTPCPYKPAPQVTYPFTDPLSGLPMPALGAAQPVVTNGTISPGIYQGINVTNGIVNMLPGTYIFTMNPTAGAPSVTVSGHGILCTGTDATCKTAGPGVTMYFACGTTFARPCGTGEAGGFISVSGQGTYELVAPTSGTYSNLVIFYDRNNVSPVTLSGGAGASVVQGSVYARSGPVNFSGNASGLFASNGGGMVANTVNLNVSTNAPNLTLAGGGVIQPPCDLYNATVSGSETSGGQTITRTGQALFTSGTCAGGARIVSFTYTP